MNRLQFERERAFSPWRITLLYGLLAILWIVASDVVVARVFPALETLFWAGILKGLLFVVFTCTALFLLVRKAKVSMEQEAQAIFESEQRYRRLSEDLPGLVCTFLPDSTLMYVNTAYCDFFKKTREELTGTPFLELLPGEVDREAVRKAYLALTPENPVVTLEQRILDGNGRERWQRWVDRAFFDPATGAAVSYQAIGLDITEQRLTEAQLRQAQKMDAIGQLAGGIAHDFNNQLTGIIGYAERLAAETADSQQKRYAENILAAARSAADLTRKLLAFARRAQVQKLPVDLHRVVADTIELLEHSIDKMVVIEQQLHAQCAVVLGDYAQLQNAVLNLALNARDAMPSGGRLRFSTETVFATPGQSAGLSLPDAEDEYICLSVTDTGCGMSEEVQSRLFEPFFTTKPAGKGTGMGLAAVYGTIKQHDGLIKVESALEKGTSFSIFLPVTVSQTSMPESTAAGPQAPAAGRRLLVIEDEELVREFLCEVLERAGCGVLAAADGQQGIEVYRSHAAEIELVILDMVMPALSGPTAFRALREINSEIKVLLMSGGSIEGEAAELMSNGATAFVQKPFTQPQLLAAVEEALKGPKAAGRREPAPRSLKGEGGLSED